MKVCFIPMALNDLKEFKDYIAFELSNQSAALDIVTKIYKDILPLENMPNLGLDLQEKIRVKTDIKYLVFGKYIVFYEILDNFVSIKRVFDSRTDYLRFAFMEYEKLEKAQN